MQTQEAYNNWAKTYDSVTNLTRDLEARVLRTILKEINVESILEIGCGTGKNTEWLAGKCRSLQAIDFSEEMLHIAREKIKNKNVQFLQSDITNQWSFNLVDLITCSLVLEHIENITFIFEQASKCLNTGGIFYICELHPYKQLQGSRAKFEKEGNLLLLDYHIHHISDYFASAKKNNFTCEDLKEWFDDDDRNQIPRIVSYQFRKK